MGVGQPHGWGFIQIEVAIGMGLHSDWSLVLGAVDTIQIGYHRSGASYRLEFGTDSYRLDAMEVGFHTDWSCHRDGDSYRLVFGMEGARCTV